MRYLLDQKSYDEMLARNDHSRDCYVRNREYLHHLYIDGVKYVVARAVYACVKEAQAANDEDALLHLNMHIQDLERLISDMRKSGSSVANLRAIGDPPPTDDEAIPKLSNTFVPEDPTTPEETGLNRTFLSEHLLRILYNRGRAAGSELADLMKLRYGVVEQLLTELRRYEQIDIAGQRGYGDINYEYILTPRGAQAASDALLKTQYAGPCPVPLDRWLASVKAQTVKNVVVTRRNIREAFQGLVIDESILNMVGPAVNSASSVMLFGYPGNGKTTIAERITHLMGDDIFIPYAIEANGSIIKMHDPIVHESPKRPLPEDLEFDRRWVRVARPFGGRFFL